MGPERPIEQADANAEAVQREAHRAMASFASMIAHDLRNPLAIATGMLELLERRAGDELSAEFAELVSRSVGAIRRTSHLVDALHAYAQMMRLDEDPTRVDLYDVAHAAAAAEVTGHGSITIGRDLPTVVIGETGIRRVFHNLFENSVRYADPSRPLHIEVGVSALDDAWEISITDNGSGIPTDRRDVVFDEGVRLEKVGDGLGLGLPAARAVLERHGGSIRVEDPADGSAGTRMVLTLPR